MIIMWMAIPQKTLFFCNKALYTAIHIGWRTSVDQSQPTLAQSVTQTPGRWHSGSPGTATAAHHQAGSGAQHSAPGTPQSPPGIWVQAGPSTDGVRWGLEWMRHTPQRCPAVGTGLPGKPANGYQLSQPTQPRPSCIACIPRPRKFFRIFSCVGENSGVGDSFENPPTCDRPPRPSPTNQPKPIQNQPENLPAGHRPGKTAPGRG